MRKFVQTQRTSLFLNCGLADTEVTLSSFLDLEGNTLTMSDFGDIGYITFEPGVKDFEEISSFNGITDNGDRTIKLTGMVRGLFGTYPYTTGGNQQAHSANSVVVVSNNPQLYDQFVTKYNDETVGGAKIFSTVPSTTGGNGVAANDLVRKAQLDAAVMGALTILNVVIPAKAGATVAIGNILYYDDAANRWLLARADQSAKCQNVILAIAQGAGVLDGAIAGGVMLLGQDGNQSGTVEGTQYFLSNTPGAISTTAGTYNVSLGFGAQSATLLYFAPRFNQQLTQDQVNALAGKSGNLPSTYNLYEDENDTSNAIDQSQTTQNGTLALGEADATTKHNIDAQSFTPRKTSMTGAVLHKAADTGSFTGTVTVSLQADSAGSPSGTPLATVTLSNAAWLATPVGAFGAIFSSEYTTLVQGSLYWIVIQTSTADNANHLNLGTNTAGGYAGGSTKFKNTTDGWTAVATIDLYFKQFTTNYSKLSRNDANGFSKAFPPYGVDTGTTDAYYVVMDGVVAYKDGQSYKFKANTANTGNATLNFNGLGAKNILRNYNVILADNEIKAGQMIETVYDATADNFQMVSPVGTVPTGVFQSALTDTGDVSSTQNIDTVFSPGFQASVIEIQYEMKGNDGTDKFSAGIARFSATTLISNHQFFSNVASAASPAAVTELSLGSAALSQPGANASVVLSILSITATQFTVRAAITRLSTAASARFSALAFK